VSLGRSEFLRILAEDPADFSSPPDESDGIFIRCWWQFGHLKQSEHCQFAGIEPMARVSVGTKSLMKLAADLSSRRDVHADSARFASRI